jgi:hypothetical protein
MNPIHLVLRRPFRQGKGLEGRSRAAPFVRLRAGPFVKLRAGFRDASLRAAPQDEVYGVATTKSRRWPWEPALGNWRARNS